MHTYTSQDRNTIEFGKKSKVRKQPSVSTVYSLHVILCFQPRTILWLKLPICPLYSDAVIVQILNAFFCIKYM